MVSSIETLVPHPLDLFSSHPPISTVSPVGLNISMNSSPAPFCPRLIRIWLVGAAVDAGVNVGVDVNVALGVNTGVGVGVSVTLGVTVGVSVALLVGVALMVAVAVEASVQMVNGLDRFWGSLGTVNVKSARLLVGTAAQSPARPALVTLVETAGCQRRQRILFEVGGVCAHAHAVDHDPLTVEQGNAAAIRDAGCEILVGRTGAGARWGG